jgi:hypothetical protein
MQGLKQRTQSLFSPFLGFITKKGKRYGKKYEKKIRPAPSLGEYRQLHSAVYGGHERGIPTLIGDGDCHGEYHLVPET